MSTTVPSHEWPDVRWSARSANPAGSETETLPERDEDAPARKDLGQAARAALVEGRYVTALGLLERSLAWSADASGWSDRGRCLVGLGRWDEALASFERAVTLDRENAPAWGALGEHLARLQRLAQARAAFARALALDAAQADALYGMARLLTRLGRSAEANGFAQGFLAVARADDPRAEDASTMS